jgi:hypothetical protein
LDGGCHKRLGARELSDDAERRRVDALSHKRVGKKRSCRFVHVFLAPQHCKRALARGIPSLRLWIHFEIPRYQMTYPFSVGGFLCLKPLRPLAPPLESMI